MLTRKLLLPLLLAVLLAACGGSEPAGGENIRKFTQGMRWQSGFIPLYIDAGQGRVYLLLDSNLNELLYQSSLPRGVGSNDIGLDRGQLGEAASVVRFEAVGDRVLLRKTNQRYRAESADGAERRSVEEAFAPAILWGFPVVARDGTQRLVDATDFMLRDSHGIARRFKTTGEGKFKIDASRSAIYSERTRAFPRNTELEALITFTGDDPGPELRAVAADPRAVSVHIHHSFIALPEPGYGPRVFHPESGFFAMTYADYAAPINQALEKRLITRHRLEKRDPTAAVSDPVAPIVYYLDRGVPEPVRSALLDGAAWWAQAFEAAGFSNAFRVELLPEGADPMDVRYNVIQWVHRATRGWSYGMRVVDPRTGEILKGHVSLGSLRVRQDLLIARGMTSAFARDDGDDRAQAMALARIRQLSAHEVGHTLGLAHNFAASMRERASVMDYPHPALRLNEAGAIDLGDAYAVGIGEWDKRAIRYGYGEFRDPSEELLGLKELVAENRAVGFRFISDPDSRSMSDFQPDSHLWDNGADPVAELRRVMALRTKALSEFGAMSLPESAPLSDLQEAIVPVYLYHRYQLEAAAKLVGGVNYRYGLRGDGDTVIQEAVAAARQRDAVEAIMEAMAPEFLQLPASVVAQIPPKAYGYGRTRESAPARTGAQFDPLTLAEAAADHSLRALLHPERLARMSLQHSADPQQLSPRQLFGRLQDLVLLAEYDGIAAAIDRRRGSLLLAHWRRLLAMDSAATEVRAAAQGALERALRLMRARSGKNSEYGDFYRFQSSLIEQTLDGRYPDENLMSVDLPPGAPI